MHQTEISRDTLAEIMHAGAMITHRIIKKILSHTGQGTTQIIPFSAGSDRILSVAVKLAIPVSSYEEEDRNLIWIFLTEEGFVNIIFHREKIFAECILQEGREDRIVFNLTRNELNGSQVDLTVFINMDVKGDTWPSLFGSREFLDIREDLENMAIQSGAFIEDVTSLLPKETDTVE